MSWIFVGAGGDAARSRSLVRAVEDCRRVGAKPIRSAEGAQRRRFGDMPSWRLAYRAKLVELAYADTTKDQVLESFVSSQGDDPANPHSYADERVLKALEDRLNLSTSLDLHGIATDRLHRAAIAALKADGAMLDTERDLFPIFRPPMSQVFKHLDQDCGPAERHRANANGRFWHQSPFLTYIGTA